MHGLLLAAGAGTRMGMPKALMRDGDGTSWLQRSVAALADGGCQSVTVVLGAQAAEARALVADGVAVVVADDWAAGMGASLRAGLAAVADDAPTQSCSAWWTSPTSPPQSYAGWCSAASGPATLARAAYDGRPGHPVVLGRDHWAGVAAVGDR